MAAAIVTYLRPARSLDVGCGIGALVSELARVSGGTALVTTPSFGDDVNGGLGLPIGDPSWQEDAAAGRRFRRIVLDDEGRPHVGHLTLATYAWWTDRFAAHGLVRDADAERAMLTHPRHGVAQWRWNLYVLRPSPGGTSDR